MIRIAFCDDDLSVLHDLSVLTDRYRLARSCAIEHTAWHSPLELMAAIERGQRWDILILDIMMPGENGMELAQEIRALDSTVKIVFLTSSPEYAVQSYTVGATFYQLKPIQENSFFLVMDRAIETCRAAKVEKLVLKCKTGITAITPDKLEYCEVSGHSLLLHLRTGQVLESTGKLDTLEEQLQPYGGFLRAHRSFLVNMNCIESISYKAVVLDCQRQIPIPHGKYNEIKQLYLAHAFADERDL